MENMIFGSVKLKSMNAPCKNAIDALHRAGATTCVNAVSKTIDFNLPYDKTALAELRENLKAGGFPVEFDNLHEVED